MSDTNNKSLVPAVHCPHCKIPIKIIASLPADNGMRQLSYRCQKCRKIETLLRKSDPE